MTVFCDNCGNDIDVELKEAEVNVEGNPMTLFYFSCPHCKRIYKISIKDKRFYMLSEDLRSAKRLRSNRANLNFDQDLRFYKMIKLKEERLKKHCKELEKRFSGTFTFVTSKNNHEDEIVYLP